MEIPCQKFVNYLKSQQSGKDLEAKTVNILLEESCFVSCRYKVFKSQGLGLGLESMSSIQKKNKQGNNKQRNNKRRMSTFSTIEPL